MNALRFYVCLALLAAAVLITGQPAAHAQDADAVFQRLLDKYHAIDALRAEFTQTMTSPYTDGEESLDGTLILNGDKYRVDTGHETLIVNGEETYVYRPLEKQVLINDVVEDESSFSPSDFLLHYNDRFDVDGVEAVQFNGQKHYKISLKPKKADAFFQQATLWMRDHDAIISRLELTDVNETRMTFTLKNVEINPALNADIFTFKPPAGVEVIDLRS